MILEEMRKKKLCFIFQGSQSSSSNWIRNIVLTNWSYYNTSLNQISTIFLFLLFIIIVFANNFYIVCNKVHRIEPNPKLSNQIKITTCLHFLHKSCKRKKKVNANKYAFLKREETCIDFTRCARLSNGSQVLDQIFLGHTNTPVTDRKGLFLFI